MEKNRVAFNSEFMKIKYLKDFDYNYDCFGNIFLFGGYYNLKNEEKFNKENFIANTLLFKVNPFKKKCKIFYEFMNPRFNCASVLINQNFYFLGGQSFDDFIDMKLNGNEKKENIQTYKTSFKVLNNKKFSFSTLMEYSLKLTKKPLIMNHCFENIFVIEDLHNFSFFSLKNKV